MAKLSARGRKPLAGVVKEYTAEALQAAADRRYPVGDPLHGPALTIWERSTKRLMSDGVILERRDVQFRPSGTWDTGRHTYPWKVIARLKAGVPATADTAARWVARYEALGYRSEGASVPRPVMLSRTRILRACQEGGSTGFCATCGAEADGVEPDARGYRCPSCGAPDVMGAEELLISMA